VSIYSIQVDTGSRRVTRGSAHSGLHVLARWTTHGLGHSNKNRWNRIGYEFDDLQIDAHGLAAFRSHNLACLPSFSTNLPQNELVLIKGLRGRDIVEQEWPVFDLKRYWKVRALGDGVLKLAIGDKAPWTGLGNGDTRKCKRGYVTRVC
jgi:hypothetical protein